MKIEKTNDLQDEQLFDGPANHLGRLGTHEEFGPWFHNLHLPGGEQTAPAHPLGDYPASAWAQIRPRLPEDLQGWSVDRKSTRLNSSHVRISYAVFCLKKKKFRQVHHNASNAYLTVAHQSFFSSVRLYIIISFSTF